MKKASLIGFVGTLLCVATAHDVAHARGMLRAPVAKIDYVDSMGYRVEARGDDDGLAFLRLTLEKRAKVVVDVRKIAAVRVPDLAGSTLWFDEAGGVTYHVFKMPFREFGTRGDGDYELVVGIADAKIRSIAVNTKSPAGMTLLECLDGDCASLP